MMDAALLASVFDKNPLLIAHMDQLARNEDLQDQDLVDLRAGGQGISSLGELSGGLVKVTSVSDPA